MDRLWSPWRSIHVSSWGEREEEDRAGVFTRIATSGEDERNLVLHRGVHCFVLLNRFPYNNGHCMIAPYRRVASFEDLTRDERCELSDLTVRCLGSLRRALSPDGFNVGMNLGEAGGAGIPQHVHVHIVPRWSGDTGFMASTADVRVMSQALEETYALLRQAFADTE